MFRGKINRRGLFCELTRSWLLFERTSLEENSKVQGGGRRGKFGKRWVIRLMKHRSNNEAILCSRGTRERESVSVQDFHDEKGPGRVQFPFNDNHGEL